MKTKSKKLDYKFQKYEQNTKKSENHDKIPKVQTS